jgi:hypothetical protein
MFKHSAKNILLPAFIMLALCNANADRVFKYPRIQQEKDNWCWDACSQWILGFHGVVMTQEEICKYGFTDSVVRDQWNYIYCPTEAGEEIISYITYQPVVLDTCYGRGINQIIKHYGVPYKVKNDMTANYILTESEFKSEIDNGHPFVVRFNWDNGGGHFVVAMGYQNQLCWLMNPWEDDGIQIYDYAWVCNNKNGALTHHVWDYTLQTCKTDTVPELTTVFPSSISAGTNVSLVLTSELNGRDVTYCTFFTSMTDNVAIDSATRTISWTQTDSGPTSVKFAREFGNARDTITKTFTSTSVAAASEGAPFNALVKKNRTSYGISVTIPMGSNQDAKIELIGLNGSRVFTKRLNGAGCHYVSLDKKTFAGGIYMLTVSQRQKILTQKIVF